MIASRLDSQITRDLAALGEDSRRQLAGVDDALQRTNMYRDDRPGVEARRDALAEERRRELVMMPLTLSHVFAHRVGRIAAGGAALACSALIILMLGDPMLLGLATWFVPGLDLAMCLTLAALGILGVYVVATWIAEAWFARRMRNAIRTGGDAYQDLDQLARGPIEIAQAAVHRVDGPSLGWFLAGATTLTLTFGYVGVIVGAVHDISTAWSISAAAELGALYRNLDSLVIAVFAAGVVALLVGRACARPTTPGLATEPTLLRVLGHWTVVPVVLLVGGATLYGALVMAVQFEHGRLPPDGLRDTLAFGATLSVVLAASWGLLWWRRREHARTGEA